MGTIFDAENKLVKHQGSTNTKAKLSIADITRLRKSYFLQIRGKVEVHKVLSQLVINWVDIGTSRSKAS